MAPSWSCVTCTYRHEDKESSYLACAMCGSSKPKKSPTVAVGTTAKRKQGSLLNHFGAKSRDNSAGGGKEQQHQKRGANNNKQGNFLQHFGARENKGTGDGKKHRHQRRGSTVKPPPHKGKTSVAKKSPLRSVVEALRPCRNSSFAPRARYRDDPKAPWCVIENDKDIPKLCPMTVIRDVLPATVASKLLEQLELESSTWNQGDWIIHGRTHKIPRTTATYNLTKDSDQNGPVRYGDEPQYAPVEDDEDEEYADQRRTISPELRQAANCISELVQRHCPWAISNENLDWQPTFAFVNRYANGTDCVGWHADHLTPLGPRPIIVGLSLGACRRFDLRRQQPAATTKKNTDTTTTNSQSTPTKSSSTSQLFRHISVPLPHNSVCIMWNDCQEQWQHSVPRCSDESMTRHPRVGNVRISLTFRRRRVLQGELGNCYCGRPAGLKAKNGKYYLFCRPYGKEKNGKTCPFWKPCSWADEEAKRMTDLQEKVTAVNKHQQPKEV